MKKKRTMRLGCILLSTVFAWDGSTDRMRADEKEYNRYKKQKAKSTKESAKEKKGRRLTDSLMNPRWIWNMPKVFRYITTKTAIR